MTSALVPPRNTARSWGDMAGIGLSITCMAHCLALPIVAAVLPMAGLASEVWWAHWAFVAVAAPLSVWTLAWPPRGRLRPAPLVLGALGLGGLLVGAAEWPGHDLATPVTLAGAVLLTIAHGLNLSRRRHRCREGGKA